MTRFVMRRLLTLIPLLLAVSLMAFFIIQLPPGSFVDTYKQSLEAQGGRINERELAALAERYGLNEPFHVQYVKWMKNIVVHGDFGNSFMYQKPVSSILAERIPRTVAISLASMLVTWMIAVPLGIVSAMKQYSFFDYLFSFINFIGLAVPGFLLALIFMYGYFKLTGRVITGLYSPEFQGAAWSLAKFGDLLKNVWLPIVVLAISGTAGIMRVMRGTLLDELRRQYVTTARAKGLPERKLILKYPVRIAINPLVSTIGWLLPSLIGGEVVVSRVLNLPTVGPVLHQALLAQDMYLAGAIVLLLSVLTVIGTLLSDIALAWLDPRIRFD